MRLPKKIAAMLTITLVAGNMSSGVINAQLKNTNTEQLIGKGRWETAIEVSKKGWTNSKEAIIVNDRAISDALAATPFADAKNAPILLSGKDKLDERTKSELNRLGVEKVYLIGGEGVLSTKVEEDLKSEKIVVDRIKGKNREKTALEIAKRLDDIKDVKEIAVVNGYNGLADAVSIAAAAADKDMAIILSNSNSGTSDSDSFINEEGIKTSYVIGGDGVISNEVVNKLPGANRVSGKNRLETNAKVLETFYSDIEIKNAYVTKDGKAKEDQLIDALAVGVLAAKNDSPVIIVNNKLSDMQKNVTNTKSFATLTQVGASGNEAAFAELKSMQGVTTYNVNTVDELNDAIAKSDANDIINMSPVTRADIDEDINISTNKVITVKLSGNYKKTITVTAPNAKVVNNGTIANIVVKGSNGGYIENAKGAKISNVEVQGSASNIEIVNKGTVTAIKNDAKGTTVDNTGGKIEKPLQGSEKPPITGNKPPTENTGGGSSSGGGSNVDTTKPVIQHVAFRRDTSTTGKLSIKTNKDGMYYYTITSKDDTLNEQQIISKAMEDNTFGEILSKEAKFLDIENIEPDVLKIHVVTKDKSNNVSNVQTEILENVLTPYSINIISDDGTIINEINNKNKDNVKVNVKFHENITGEIQLELTDSDKNKINGEVQVENENNKDIIINSNKLNDGEIKIVASLKVGDELGDRFSTTVSKNTNVIEAPTTASIKETNSNKENVINSLNVADTVVDIEFEALKSDGTLQVELSDGESKVEGSIEVKKGETSKSISIDSTKLKDSTVENPNNITISAQINVGGNSSEKATFENIVKKDTVAPGREYPFGRERENYITIPFAEELDTTSIPEPTDFEVKYPSNDTYEKYRITNIEMGETYIILYIEGELTFGSSSRLSYKGSKNKIKDKAGNECDSFEDVKIDVGS